MKPERVASILGLAPAGLWLAPFNVRYPGTAIARNLASSLKVVSPFGLKYEWGRKLGFGDVSPQWRKYSYQLCLDATLALGDAAGYFPAWDALLKKRFDEKVSQSVPITIVFGDSDKTLPASSCQEKSLAPEHATWINWESCGHAPMWDYPERVVGWNRKVDQMITVIYFWQIKRVDIPFALFRMAIDRTLLAQNKGVTLQKCWAAAKAKLSRQLMPTQLAGVALVVIPENQLAAARWLQATIRAWRKKSVSEFRVVLDPIAATGMWSKQKPFEPSAPANFQGQVVAITRARIKASQTMRFFKSVPPVTASLHSSPGLISTIGIGEAPIGLQGTFSLWESMQAIKDFAYKGAAHQKAIAQTSEFDWYAEELFARFAVREIRGKI
jgi:hypothetical protein